MAVEDDPNLSDEDTGDEVEIEEIDQIDDDADEGDADEDAEAAASATDGDGQEAEGQARPVKKPASDTIRELRARAQEAERRAQETERRLAEREAASRQPQETPAQREARLSEMDPEQRLRYELNEVRTGFGNELAKIRFESADASDRTAFDGLCARSPVAAKLRDEVEARLAEMRRTGTTAPRDTVLKYLIGDRALANANRATGKATRRAADNTARQTSRPASARSDQGSTRSAGSEQDARRKRLEDMSI